MSANTGGVKGQSSLQWGTSTNDAEKTRTTQTATFSSAGKEYKVTVSFNRQAVMEKYDVEDDQVDATIQNEISKIGKEQLSKLSGHSISTSLSDPAAKPRFKKIEDANYRDMPDTIPDGPGGDLFRTINSVRSIFAQALGPIKGDGEELEIEIEEVKGPKISFTEQKEGSKKGFSLEKVGTQEEIVAAAKIAKALPEGHPFKNKSDKLVPIVRANELDFEGKDDLFDEYTAQISSIIEELTDDIKGQNTLLSHLKNEKLGDAIYQIRYTAELKIVKSLLVDHPLANEEGKLIPLVRANLDHNNDQQDYNDIEKMLDRHQPKFTEAEKHEVLDVLVHQDKAYEIREKLGLQKLEIIKADSSQGTIVKGKELIGIVACASICARAIQHLIQMKGIHNANELVHIMNQGIQDHAELGSEAKIFGDKPLQGLKDRLKGKNIESHHIFERNDIANFEEHQFVVVTAVQGNASNMGETILLFRQGDKYCVFNSHGTSHAGKSIGASVRQFNSHYAMRAYVEKKYNNHHIKADLISPVSR